MDEIRKIQLRGGEGDRNKAVDEALQKFWPQHFPVTEAALPCLFMSVKEFTFR